MLPLNCVRCNRAVESMDDSDINSPSGALPFTTEGHSGSTIFDPLNGCYIEINICDECIRELGEMGQVLMGQGRKQVVTYTDDLQLSLVVGWYKVQRELVPWHPGLETEGLDDRMVVEPSEVGTDMPGVQWIDSAVEHIRSTNQ
jgi:hypothetical protein